MSKCYYAAIYRRKKFWHEVKTPEDLRRANELELVEVVRYHDEHMTNSEVRSIRDSEVRNYNYGNYVWRAVKAKDVPKLLRKLWSIKPYERFFGEIKFCQQFDGGSGYTCATVTDYICHG